MTVDVKVDGKVLTVFGDMIGSSFRATGSWPGCGIPLSDLSAYATWEIRTRPDPHWSTVAAEHERKLAGMIPAKVVPHD